MPKLEDLLAHNKDWAAKMVAEDPSFFKRLAEQQAPEYLWLGCADSRIPANQILGLLPGEVFVHRNIANVILHADVNAQSVIQYAVEVLKVKHIIVCGHYGCGGVAACMSDQRLGLIDQWLLNIKDVFNRNEQAFYGLEEKERLDLLCELNVRQQVENVARSTTVQSAWLHNQPLTVHGWIYCLEDGLIQDLQVSVASHDELVAAQESGIL